MSFCFVDYEIFSFESLELFLVFNRSTFFLRIEAKKEMADDLSSSTDRLVTPESLNSERGSNQSIESSGESSKAQGSTSLSMDGKTEEDEATEQRDVAEEEEPLIQSVECRICQEEDSVKNLESPCSCSGSLKVIFH